MRGSNYEKRINRDLVNPGITLGEYLKGRDSVQPEDIDQPDDNDQTVGGAMGDLMSLLSVLSGDGVPGGDVPGSDDPDLFGDDFTMRSHPAIPGAVQYIGTVGSVGKMSIVRGSGVMSPAGSYELGYKTAGNWVIEQNSDPAVIMAIIDGLRDPSTAEDIDQDNS